MPHSDTVSFDTVKAAAASLAGIVNRTPLIGSKTLSRILGAEIWLKLENLQYTASFKERGAYVKLASLTEAQRKRGVIAMSAGNHAQGVAYQAKRLGIPATIVMPSNTPVTKVENTRLLGAHVILSGDTLEQARKSAEELRHSRDLTFVHPFDDPKIIAGQGTVALEMMEDRPDLEVLVVPIGGGGLIAGIATAAKALNSGIEIIGVETELYPCMYQGLRNLPYSGRGVSIAEGIAVQQPGELPLGIVRDKVDDVLLVSEQSIERAVTMMIEIEKMVVEGAGAAGLAAVLQHNNRFRGRRIGVVACGGNIDTRLLSQILMRALIRQGRMVRLRLEIPDQPGHLAKVTALLGQLEANIIEVHHQRFFYDIPAKATDVDVVLEVRNMDHAQQLVGTLIDHGYGARLLESSSKG